MVLKPKSITQVGILQTLLAASFVIWLLFFPNTGDNFAWPVVPRLTAMFIGTSFIIRTYLGIHLWRQKYWYKLRWQAWGNYGFLAVILLATFWHVGEMNWSSNIWIAHIWVVAYIVEPLTLPLFEPRGESRKEAFPEEEKLGPILPGLKRLLAVIFNVGVALSGLLFINPEFMNIRWPWPLDPFDARVMAAFPMLAGLWALQAYLSEDWAEVKPAVQGLLMYGVGLFVVWAINWPVYDQTRENVWEYGVISGILTAVTLYYYIKQERAKV
jgi:hypothetical protein